MKAPSTTVEFLDALKARKGLTTDYQLHKAMGWHQTTVSSYRCGKSSMSSAHAMRVAEELGLPHAYVVACMQAERENNADVAKVWKAIADHFKSAAAIILIALGFLTPAQDAHAAQGNPALQGGSNSAYPCIYYAKRLAAWIAGWFRTEFPALAVPA